MLPTQPPEAFARLAHKVHRLATTHDMAPGALADRLAAELAEVQANQARWAAAASVLDDAMAEGTIGPVRPPADAGHHATLWFLRRDVLALWPDEAPRREPAPIYSTGAPGRRTSMHLIKTKMQQRAKAGEMLTSTALAEARWLSQWLAITHPEAAPATPKTIRNRLGRLWKSFVLKGPK